MENNKLISMRDFVLEQKQKLEYVYGEANDPLKIDEERINYICSSINYAKFLSKPLQLGFFVPCDLEGNVLEEPNDKFGENIQGKLNYQIAKEKCLFEGFEIVSSKIFNEGHIKYLAKIANVSKYADLNPFKWNDKRRSIETIEDLIPYNLTLTPTAIKEIYGEYTDRRRISN